MRNISPTRPTATMAMEADLPMLRHMLQGYLADLDRVLGGMEVDETGAYVWGADPSVYLDHPTTGCGMWLVRVGEEVVGFVLVRDVSDYSDDVGRSLEAIYTHEAWRRRGIGLAVARRIVVGLGGTWQFRQFDGNTAGMSLALRGLFTEVGPRFRSSMVMEDGRAAAQQVVHLGPGRWRSPTVGLDEGPALS